MVSLSTSPSGRVSPCAAHVERDQPNARRRPIEAERLVDVAAQAVLEHERQAVAFVAKVELQTVMFEDRHRSSPRLKLDFSMSRKKRAHLTFDSRLSAKP